ncbi:hypothetical protein DRO29_04045 [Candidatus Bathyarchaeota archaeon]|nr:MAG: hypothetical protein DRO29_04045 [Candidatus Bathyarchaeota archaeon]
MITLSDDLPKGIPSLFTMFKTAFKMEAVFFSEAVFSPFLGELLVQNDAPARPLVSLRPI